MFTVRVIASLKPTAAAEALDQLRREVAEVPEQFAGCECFEVFVDPTDSTRFLLYEEWTDRSAFEAYRTSDYFEAGGAILFPAIAGAPNSAYYASELVSP